MNDVLFQLLEFPGLTDHCHKVAHICNTIMIFSMKLCLKVLSNTKFLPHKEISSSSTCRMRKKESKSSNATGITYWQSLQFVICYALADRILKSIAELREINAANLKTANW